MQWYYLDEQKEQKPFDENYIAALVADKRIGPETLVWDESLPNWSAAASVFPGSFPGVALSPGAAAVASQPVRQTQTQTQAPPQQQQQRSAPVSQESSPQSVSRRSGVEVKNEKLREMVKDFASYINAQSGWLKFVGVMLIIAGAINALTIVGLLVAWLPIWSGVLLIKAANSAKLAEMAGTTDSMEDALYRLGLFFKINGITMLVMTIAYVVLIVIMFLTVGASIFMMPGMPGGGGFEELNIPQQ